MEPGHLGVNTVEHALRQFVVLARIILSIWCYEFTNQHAMAEVKVSRDMSSNQLVDRTLG